MPKRLTRQVHAVHGIPGRSLVITSSSLAEDGPHFLTTWDLPAQDERPSERQLLPALIGRAETPTPQVQPITGSERFLVPPPSARADRDTPSAAPTTSMSPLAPPGDQSPLRTVVGLLRESERARDEAMR